jgi:hypothetical protein
VLLVVDNAGDEALEDEGDSSEVGERLVLVGLDSPNR